MTGILGINNAFYDFFWINHLAIGEFFLNSTKGLIINEIEIYSI